MNGLLDEAMRDTVADVFQAYNAMETTKRRHFDYLNVLESKRKKFNLQATADESLLLKTLLEDHDRAVKTFKNLAQLLQQADPQAHTSLFTHIGVLNAALGDAGHTAAH